MGDPVAKDGETRSTTALPKEPLVIKPLEYVWLLWFMMVMVLCGLCTNFVQLLNRAVVWNVDKIKARYLNQLLHSQFLMIFTFLLEWWSGIKIVVYGDKDIFETMATENTVCIPNHPGKLDWLVGVAIAARAGQLGCTRVVLKKDLLYVPIVGWTFFFTEMVFLNRDWAKDEGNMMRAFTAFAKKEFPEPWCFIIFPEGTRRTDDAVAKSQEIARAKNADPARAGMKPYPILNNVLLPRKKGFIATVNTLRPAVNNLLDFTIADMPDPFAVLLGRGVPENPEIHVRIGKVPITDVPSEEDKMFEWCLDCFERKDTALQYFADHGEFDPATYVAKEGYSGQLKVLGSFCFWSFATLVVLQKAVGAIMAGSTTVLVTLLSVVGMLMAFLYVAMKFVLKKTDKKTKKKTE